MVFPDWSDAGARRFEPQRFQAGRCGREPAALDTLRAGGPRCADPGFLFELRAGRHPQPDRRCEAPAGGAVLIRLEDLPKLNAVLNATAAVLLVCAYVLIRRGRRKAHKRVMLSAFTVSVLFLISYLTYHAQVGSVHYPHSGAIRSVYLSILFTHTVLAAT